MDNENLYGLILAGGKSTRMGMDKDRISYHGLPQSLYLFSLLDKLCQNTFLSIRADQQKEYSDYNFVVDENIYRGPFNGILSAHKENPEAAWLVIACDLPLIDQETLQLLVSERDRSKKATALATDKTGLPEPLAAIWEADGLKQVPDYLQKIQSSCPRKYLLNSDIKLVVPQKDEVLLNANFEEEYLEVMQKLSAL
ncbi:MAG: NTP transferase domain-containing protein [Flavobacteriaceae bacterium]